MRVSAYHEREIGKPTVGIPMALNMFELLPFWHTLFCHLGFNVVVSSDSTRETFISGQHTIPSDTICYPAKLLHGHMESLLKMQPDIVFYPCMSYNVDEGIVHDRDDTSVGVTIQISETSNLFDEDILQSCFGS